MNVKTTKEFKQNKLAFAINYHLRGKAISAISSEVVDCNFHARYSCKRRTYIYKILNRSAKSPIYKNRAWLLPYKLDFQKMQEVALLFLGTHDFSNFRNINCEAKNPVKTIEQIQILKNENFIEITISAQSFLYNMVRSIVGLIAEVGRGKISKEEVKNRLAKSGKFKETELAPPHGLYFLKAEFE